MSADARSDDDVDHMLWSRLCSLPTFIKAWETGEKDNSSISLYFSRYCSSKLRLWPKQQWWAPRFFFSLPQVMVCQVLFMSGCCLQGCFPVVVCSMCFSFSTIIVRNAVGWLSWLTDMQEHSSCTKKHKYKQIHAYTAINTDKKHVVGSFIFEITLCVDRKYCTQVKAGKTRCFQAEKRTKSTENSTCCVKQHRSEGNQLLTQDSLTFKDTIINLSQCYHQQLFLLFQ